MTTARLHKQQPAGTWCDREKNSQKND